MPKLVIDHSSEDEKFTNLSEKIKKTSEKTIQRKIETTLNSQSIILKGSWDNWKGEYKMKKRFNALKNTYVYSATINLPDYNRYFFKFIVDGGNWTHDPNKPYLINKFGTYDNYLVAERKLMSPYQSFNYSHSAFQHMNWRSDFIVNNFWEDIQGQI